MDLRLLLALCLLYGLEADCQTFPHLTFGNNNPIPNHGYVDLGTVRVNYFCHTDLSTCCTSQEGIYRGQWYFCNGQPVTQNDDNDFYQREGDRKVDLYLRKNATSPTGIYHCEIPTNAVHDDANTSVRASVYVGLYTSQGTVHELVIVSD